MTTKIVTAETGAPGTDLATGGNYGGDNLDLVAKTGGGNLTLSAAAGKAARGAQSIRLVTTGATDTALIRMTGFAGTDIAAHFTFLPDAYPAADTTICQTRHASGPLCSVLLLADGKVRLNDASGVSPFTSPTALPLTGGPPRFSLFHVKGASTTTGTLKFAVYADADDTTPLWTFSSTTANTGTADPAAAQFGKVISTGDVLNGYFDDIRVSDQEADLLPPETVTVLPAAERILIGGTWVPCSIRLI